MKIDRLQKGHFNIRVVAAFSGMDGDAVRVDVNLGTLWAPRSEEAYEILKAHLTSGESMSLAGLRMLLKQLETGEMVDEDEDESDE